MRIVTISAQYGTGGSRIGPAVADAIGVPFVDRAIPVRVASAIGVSVEQSLAHDDSSPAGWVSRWLTGAAQVATASFAPAGAAATEALLSDQAFVAHTEQVIRELAETTGGVILGRAAAIVLAEYPEALHVRLHAPQARRLHHAMAAREVDEATAEREMVETDRARTAYVKRFYRRDPDDPWLYHLICDPTVVAPAAVVDVIATAARAIPEV